MTAVTGSADVEMISYRLDVRNATIYGCIGWIIMLYHLADRVAGPPREDLPLPTAPPYTAFVGNLAFDLTEMELEDFFAGLPVRNHNVLSLSIKSQSPADKICQNYQGQRGKAQRLRLCRVCGS